MFMTETLRSTDTPSPHPDSPLRGVRVETPPFLKGEFRQQGDLPVEIKSPLPPLNKGGLNCWKPLYQREVVGMREVQ